MSTDRLTVQLVVVFIGLFGLATIGGMIALAYVGRTSPDTLSTLGGAAVGALGSLLARTSTSERREDSTEDKRSSPSENGASDKAAAPALNE